MLKISPIAASLSQTFAIRITNIGRVGLPSVNILVKTRMV
jgi:hypothetical protein